MAIEVNNIEYYFSYNTNDINYKWNKLCSSVTKIRTYDYDNKNKKQYSESEVNKLKIFSRVSTDLLSDILSCINKKEDTICYIEGFSYGQGSSQIIDIVGISSAIRIKLYELIPNIQIKILAPKSLKTNICGVVYGKILTNIGKKRPKIVEISLPNKRGITGGNFTKIDMHEAILDSNFISKWKDFIDTNKNEINKNKSIPKPIEDINDAFLLKELAKLN